jgi:hypothetical protein
MDKASILRMRKRTLKTKIISLDMSSHAPRTDVLYRLQYNNRNKKDKQQRSRLESCTLTREERRDPCRSCKSRQTKRVKQIKIEKKKTKRESFLRGAGRPAPPLP